MTDTNGGAVATTSTDSADSIPDSTSSTTQHGYCPSPVPTKSSSTPSPLSDHTSTGSLNNQFCNIIPLDLIKVTVQDQSVLDHSSISFLLSAVCNVEHSEECEGGNSTGRYLKDSKQESTNINTETDRPNKRRRLSDSLSKEKTQNTRYGTTVQAVQNETIAALLEDKAKLSLQVSKLADELVQTKLAKNFLRSHKERERDIEKEKTAATERYLRYESRWYSERVQEAQLLTNTTHNEMKLIEAKSKFLLKKTQEQSKTLKQNESFINDLKERMELIEAKKNIRIQDLEHDLRKALVYVDGLHKHYNVSPTASAILARQFCDNLQEEEQSKARQLVTAGNQRNDLKRKRLVSES